MSSPSQPPSGSEPQPAQPEPASDKSNMDATTEIQSRFNELRRELLDHRVKLVDWWLAATAIFLTLLGVVAVIAGYFSFQRFHEIEKEARQYMEMVKGHEETAGEGAKTAKGHAEDAGEDAKEAEEHKEKVKQIRYIFDPVSPSAKPSPEGVTTEITQSDSDKTSQAAETVQENPLLDQARTDAISLQQKGKVEEAIEKWRSIANIAGETDTQLQARAWFSVGYLYGEEENWQASIDAYDKVLELEPDNADAYNNRGVAQNELGEHVAALMDYDEAIRLAPDDTSAYNNRGNAKSDLDQNEAALADYGKALELDPNNASAYHNRGNAKFDLGQHDEALVDYNEAIRLNPALVEAYNNRGIVKNKLGQHDEALADLNEAIRLKHDYVGAYNNRGVTKNDLGRLNEAREDYQKALALAQESGNENLIAMVKRNLSRLDNDQAP